MGIGAVNAPLSVVVASVNGMPYLGECLEALQRNAPNTEVVVAEKSWNASPESGGSKRWSRRAWHEDPLVRRRDLLDVDAIAHRFVAAAEPDLDRRADPRRVHGGLGCFGRREPRGRRRGVLRARCRRAGALSRLIDGSLPLDDWVAVVRTKQPEPARFEGGLWRRVAAWYRRLRARRRTRRPQLSSTT